MSQQIITNFTGAENQFAYSSNNRTVLNEEVISPEILEQCEMGFNLEDRTLIIDGNRLNLHYEPTIWTKIFGRITVDVDINFLFDDILKWNIDTTTGELTMRIFVPGIQKKSLFGSHVTNDKLIFISITDKPSIQQLTTRLKQEAQSSHKQIDPFISVLSDSGTVVRM